MNEALMAAAYETARDHFKAAELATFQTLDASFPDEQFDSIHQASQQGMRLHIALSELARKIWSGMISHGKAEEIIRNQFPDFPEATLRKALGDACTDAR